MNQPAGNLATTKVDVLEFDGKPNYLTLIGNFPGYELNRFLENSAKKEHLV